MSKRIVSYDRQRQNWPHQSGLFIKGPIPAGWLAKVFRLPGSALKVAMVFWLISGMSKTEWFASRPSLMRAFGLTRKRVAKAVAGLVAAGIIECQQHPGCTHRVRLILNSD